MTHPSAKLLETLKTARRYIDGAYECAFPDEAENLAALNDVDEAIALLESEVAAVEAAKPVGRRLIRDIFMQHGFTIKDGQTDLKDYVYAAAEALVAEAQVWNRAEPAPGWQARAVRWLRGLPTASAVYKAGPMFAADCRDLAEVLGGAEESPQSAAGAEKVIVGSVLLCRRGLVQDFRARRRDFFGHISDNDAYVHGAEDIARADLEFAGLAPHTQAFVYEQPAADALPDGVRVDAYGIGSDHSRSGVILVQRMSQMDGSDLWAVRNRHGSVLAKDGQWEFEPQPSSRDDAFMERCRYATHLEALQVAQAAHDKV